MTATNEDYVEINKGSEHGESDAYAIDSDASSSSSSVDEEEGGVGVVRMPPPRRPPSRCRCGLALAIFFTFAIGFLSGTAAMYFGRSQFDTFAADHHINIAGISNSNSEAEVVVVEDTIECAPCDCSKLITTPLEFDTDPNEPEQKENANQPAEQATQVVEEEAPPQNTAVNEPEQKEDANQPTEQATQVVEEAVVPPPDTALPTTISTTFTVLEKVTHDPSSFTQGLSYGPDHKSLFETTGLYGKSKIQRINPETFEVEQTANFDAQFFGEGSTFYKDAEGNNRLIMITWKKKTGYIYDADSFEQIRSFQYTTTPPKNEGWGITYDKAKQEFIVSDGSQYLYFWDRDTLEEKRKVAVTRFNGREQNELNELEFMDGLVCANIWYSDHIICVDPDTGKSVREYDMSSLWPRGERNSGSDVLNGIALGDGFVLIGGKKWSTFFKVEFPDWPTLFSSDVEENVVIANESEQLANEVSEIVNEPFIEDNERVDGDNEQGNELDNEPGNENEVSETANEPLTEDNATNEDKEPNNEDTEPDMGDKEPGSEPEMEHSDPVDEPATESINGSVNEPTNEDSEPVQGNGDGGISSDAVSYNFLRTSKGTDTIRTLLDDLIHKGPRNALTHLSVLMKNDSQILDSCHPLAHNLGRAAYKYFGGLDEAYDGMVGTDDAHFLRLCNAAYLHGVIESSLRDVEDVSNLASASRDIEDKICNNLTNVPLGDWECRHGIGHGIIQRYRLDAEKDVIQKAIDTCLETEGAADCENGLWMDHFAVSGNILAMETRLMSTDVVATQLKSSFMSSDQLVGEDFSAIEQRFQPPPVPTTLKICRYQKTDNCFIYAATEYLLVHPKDYLGALQYCTNPSAELGQGEVMQCISGVGSQIVKENLNDLSILESVCQTLDAGDSHSPQGINCFMAGVSYYNINSGGMVPQDEGLCDKLAVYKEECLSWGG